jgi:hypothetical protein
MRMLAAILLLPIAALAVQPARSEGPPAWAYPVNPPDFKPVPDDGKPRSVPDRRAVLRFPISLRTGGSPTCSLAVFVIGRLVKAARKMLTSPDCQRATLFNRGRTTKAE